LYVQRDSIMQERSDLLLPVVVIVQLYQVVTGKAFGRHQQLSAESSALNAAQVMLVKFFTVRHGPAVLASSSWSSLNPDCRCAPKKNTTFSYGVTV